MIDGTQLLTGVQLLLLALCTRRSRILNILQLSTIFQGRALLIDVGVHSLLLILSQALIRDVFEHVRTIIVMAATVTSGRGVTFSALGSLLLLILLRHLLLNKVVHGLLVKGNVLVLLLAVRLLDVAYLVQWHGLVMP